MRTTGPRGSCSSTRISWARTAVALRGDGVVLVVSPYGLWFVKSSDGWAQGAVFDKIDLDLEGFPTSVVVGERDRTYVLHGRVMEGILGNSERETFKIEEVRSPKKARVRMFGFTLWSESGWLISCFGGFR
ncbi:hypothetical protein E2542_SST05558 [Spatholobus suberectus]|nr:hypothetical protein E2542_SST05558 [Spatholobus suberectus]